MCAVSMISDYYTSPRWPINPVKEMDYDTARKLRKVIDQLDEIDKRLKDVECFDEKKQKFLDELDQRLEALKNGS